MTKILEIYTDGSHLDKLRGGRLGCGGVLVNPQGPGMGTLINSYSLELTPERLKDEIGTSEVSNPTAEMLGALEALRKFKEDLKGAIEVTIYADYNGVKYFNEGKWKCKEVYIAKIKDLISQEIQNQGLKGRVKFEWVKGHQSKSIMSREAYWNRVVDGLAKGDN